jgi:large subunit ribosomal protein L15e
MADDNLESVKKKRTAGTRRSRKSPKTEEPPVKTEAAEADKAGAVKAPRRARKQKAEREAATPGTDAAAVEAEKTLTSPKSAGKTVKQPHGSPVKTAGEERELPPILKLEHGRGRSMYAHMGSFRKKSLAKALGDTDWERLISWRKEENYRRIDHPTRLNKARSMGYKAKQGITLVRVRVRRGGLRKRRIAKGRRAKRKGILRITMKKNIQRIAEERVQRRYPNMEVLNSYQVGQDGMHKWYEVILVDPYNPSVLSDKNLNWISNQAHSGRAFRGLTSAGTMGRGLRWKGKGVEKVRPSIRANDRKGK